MCAFIEKQPFWLVVLASLPLGVGAAYAIALVAWVGANLPMP